MISYIIRPWWTIFKKNIYTVFGKPYFKVFFNHQQKIGVVGVDAHYNVHFLYMLDAAYAEAKSDVYTTSLDEEAKLAIYMSDTINALAEPYIPLSEELEQALGDNIPAMRLNGGEEVKQVVDIAEKVADKSSLDVRMG